MDAATSLHGLMTAIDEHRWHDLARFLHAEFTCHLVHTGETFDRDEWIRFNAEYPGFDRLHIEELVTGDDRAACRLHIVGRDDDGERHYGCASFATVRDGLIVALTEVWTDMDLTAPPGTRPA